MHIKMDIEHTLSKVEKWYRTMTKMCIFFAVLAFILWLGTLGVRYDSVSYANAVARFWSSFALAVVFGVLSATISKVYEVLERIVYRLNSLI